MKYYFKLSEMEKRVKNLVNGRPNIKCIRLYPETDQILNDFEHNTMSDWWGVWKYGTPSHDFTEFDTKADAEKAYLDNELREAGERIYHL